MGLEAASFQSSSLFEEFLADRGSIETNKRQGI